MINSKFNSKLLKFVLSLITVVVLAGCSSMDNDGQDESMLSGSPIDSAPNYATDAHGNRVNNVFYFPYDSSELTSAARQDIQLHANYLAEHKTCKVRVEGHTDERGSREYNIALGQRRAQSVADILLAYGAKRNQIAVVSYGEEKPAVFGHDESVWSQNRRAIIAYEAN